MRIDMPYFLGADLGGTKTHIVIADETGSVIGFGQVGPGNHQSVGFEGMLHNLQSGVKLALKAGGFPVEQISGACFGIAGYDWPTEKPQMRGVIDQLGLACSYRMVNDAILPLVAGASEGWGISLISGTGCNCRGWDPRNRREGRVTGYGYLLGEFAGATELVWRAMQLVANEWTRRGPATALSRVMIEYAGAKDLADLLEGYSKGIHHIDQHATPLIFEVARQGDPVARELIHWAGVELGEMAKSVIRQLGFEGLEFDVVLAGSMFDGGPMLIEPLFKTITQLAPGARLVRLAVPPVIGAVILGMEEAGLVITPDVRCKLTDTLKITAAGNTTASLYG
jgi:N-acetylglucosamine kinase-like BadF-type ATPase